MRTNHIHTRNLLLILCVLALTACGFHLRGVTKMSFTTLHIEKHGATSIARELQRTLSSSGVSVVSREQDAEMLLELMQEDTEKRILSLSGGGKVREYELIYRVTLRMRSASSELWGAPQTIEFRRDFSYDDRELLAKEGEEARLYGNMRSEAVHAIMRRLSAQQVGEPAAAN